MTYDTSTVAYPMASSIYEYFGRCLDLGAAEGELGDMKLESQVRELVRCIHHVLAGGQVTTELDQRGSMDIYNDLEKRFDEGLHEANEINKAAGYYVSIVP